MVFIQSGNQALESLPPDKSTSKGHSMESNTRKDALQSKLPGTERQQKTIKSTPTDDSVELNTRKDALQAKVPWTERQQKTINFFPTPSSLQSLQISRIRGKVLEMATFNEMPTFNEMLSVNPVVAEPL
jgi:hypothetical protein